MFGCNKKTAGALFFVLCVAFVGGVAGIVADRTVLPLAAAHPFFSRWGIFKKASENTVIINKTEQVVVREDDSVETLAGEAARSVVNILSVRREGANIQRVGSYGSEKSDILQGSGILLTNDGLIATSNEALLEGASYTVFLYNGSSYPAEFAGSDSLTGISYLKISASNLPAISFADQEEIRAGEKLILIGNTAEEYRNRYSTGLLGSIDKTFNMASGAVASSEKWEGVFLVDAATTEPYIGGPAIDYEGRLVGMVGVTDRDGRRETFLLPVPAIRSSLERKSRDALDTRPLLGVSYISLTKAYAVAHDMVRDRGALVFSASGKQSLAVLSGSPAERAGIRVGDIIIAVNGREINLDSPLSIAIGSLNRGDTVLLRVLRNESESVVEVAL